MQKSAPEKRGKKGPHCIDYTVHYTAVKTYWSLNVSIFSKASNIMFRIGQIHDSMVLLRKALELNQKEAVSYYAMGRVRKRKTENKRHPAS